MGEQVARYAGDKLGVTNPHAKNALNVGGEVLGGAIADGRCRRSYWCPCCMVPALGSLTGGWEKQ